MSYFSNLAVEIDEMFYQGFSAEEIAVKLNLPLSDVQVILDTYDEQLQEYNKAKKLLTFFQIGV